MSLRCASMVDRVVSAGTDLTIFMKPLERGGEWARQALRQVDDPDNYEIKFAWVQLLSPGRSFKPK